MNNEGRDKNTNSNSDNAAPQGIFSTPELTVDTEKITPTQDADHKARIASFFADTDASKQAQQVQNAMVVPTNYATEDLVIDNGGKKKRSILPIIIAIVAVLAVGGGAAAYFLLNKPTQNTETPLAAFNNFRDYLEKGPEEYHQEEDGESKLFLYEINLVNMTNDELQDYVTTLNNKYTNFLRILTTSNSSNDTSLIERAKTYQKNLQSLINNLSIDLYSTELLKIFTNDGSSKASEYIESAIPKSDSDTLWDISSSDLNEYMQTQLLSYQVLNSHNCIIDDRIDYSCSDELTISSSTYQNLLEKSLESLESIADTTLNLEEVLTYETQIIKALLENDNA